MEVQGKIKMIGETQVFGTNGFRKREIVITTEEQYPQHIAIEFVQDKTDLLNAFALGQFVKIGINLRGREWVNPQGEAKYFNSIQGWRIDAIKEGEQPQEKPEKEKPKSEGSGVKDDEDDLPF